MGEINFFGTDSVLTYPEDELLLRRVSDVPPPNLEFERLLNRFYLRRLGDFGWDEAIDFDFSVDCSEILPSRISVSADKFST